MGGFILKWWHIARPGTLSAGVSPVLVGLLTVGRRGIFYPWIAVLTLLAAVSIQVLTNFINDYYDYRRGADGAGRLGPRRAISMGDVSPAAMLVAIGIAGGIAVLCGLVLVVHGGWPIFLIGVFSLFFGWLYTATRFSLSYLGIADIFVLLFFGPVASVGTAYLQSGVFSEEAFWLGCVCGLISTAVLVVNNVRDFECDRRVGKRTLTVRFGKFFGESEYLFVFLLCLPCLWLGGASYVLYAVVFPGIVFYFRLRSASGEEYNRLLILTGVLNLFFVFLYFLVFLFEG